MRMVGAPLAVEGVRRRMSWSAALDHRASTSPYTGGPELDASSPMGGRSPVCSCDGGTTLSDVFGAVHVPPNHQWCVGAYPSGRVPAGDVADAA